MAFTIPITETHSMFPSPTVKKFNIPVSSSFSDDKKLPPFPLPEITFAFSSGDYKSKMCVDWKETTEAHFLKMELPGMKKEEVKVDMDDASHVLTISGKKIREEKKEGDTWHIAEIRSGKFSRSFDIPKNAKV